MIKPYLPLHLNLETAYSKLGAVLDVFPNNKFLVRCSGGVLIIHNYEGITPNIGDVFDITDSPFKNFKRNVYGFFDI